MKYLSEFVQKFIELSDKYESFYILIEICNSNDTIYKTSIAIGVVLDPEDEWYKESGHIILSIEKGELSIESEYGFNNPIKRRELIIEPYIEYKPPKILYEEKFIKDYFEIYDKKEYNIDKILLVKIIKIFTRLIFMSIEKIFKNIQKNIHRRKQRIHIVYSDSQKYNETYGEKDTTKKREISISIDNYPIPQYPFKLHSTTLFDIYRFLSTKKYNDEIINATHQVITALIKEIGEKLEQLEKKNQNL